MDKYTIFDQAGPGTGVAPARDVESLPDPARRDLEAALQLLAERAQYLTGASGAAIALREGGEMVCRASAGRAAPELGVEIETDSGLTAESIRTHQFVRCDDADSDPRVNRESCRELGVKSVMVMPLLRDQEVAGVFELVADRTSAFEERDVAALIRLGEMTLTAMEHAEATRRALPGIAEAENTGPWLEERSDAAEPLQPIPGEQKLPSSLPAEIAQIGSCQACGFPVSQGRTLCVDCERVEQPAEKRPPLTMGREEAWWQAHSYTLGALLIAALTLVLLALRLR